MNTNRSVARSSILLLCVLFSPSTFSANDYPRPEEYLQPTELEQGDPAGYAKAARDFLASHPDSSMAPRVAFDLLMLAKVFQDLPALAEMRRLLALDYAQSLQARYYRSTFANAEDYRRILSELIDQFSRRPDPEFPGHFARGLGAALDDYGDQLLNDPDFLLKSAYLLQAAGETAGQEDLLARLEPMLGEDDDLARIAGIAADSDQSAAEKAVALHGMSTTPSARFLRDLLLFQMTEDARQAPAIRQISAEAAIQDNRFADALALLPRQAPTDGGDKILFQRAWSHAALGQHDEARALIDQLAAEYPDSPWLTPGHALKESQEHYDARLKAFSNALISAAKTIADLDAFEGTLLYTAAPDGRPITAYVAMDLGKNFFATQLRRAETLELAYETGPDGAMLYKRGDKVLRRALEPGPVPSFKVELQRGTDGGFNFSLAANLEDNLGDLIRENRALLESPLLTTRAGRDELLNSLRESGNLLGEVKQTDGGTNLTLLRPDARDPDASSTTLFQLNEAGQLIGLTVGDIRIEDMRYGESGAMAFSQPEWPPLDTLTTEEFDAGFFFGIIENMAQIFIQPGQR